MSKKKPKTYNHYVSQFYFKNFSGNDSIGRYNFDRKEFVKEAAIRNTAGRDFLYGKNSDLEDWFQNLEGVWATIIRNILLYEKIPRVCQVKCVNYFDFLWRSFFDRHMYTINLIKW